MERVSAWIDAATGRYGWLPDWALNLMVVAAFGLAGLIAHRIVSAIAQRALSRRRPILTTLVRRIRRPTRWAFVVAALNLGIDAAPLPGEPEAVLRRILAIVFIGLCGWYVLIALDVVSRVYMSRFRLDVSDNLLARKHHTQIRILHRALATLVVVLTIALALMTLPGVRQYGVSLLAAGGAAGIVVGLALQPLLTNLLAGLQIAMTQPIRIDDAVIVEGEWGKVEEITSTYVVVRIWDWRRLILPLSYFIQQPFQNWTRETARLIGSVHLYLDHTAPVAELRAKLEEIVVASPLWDKDVVGLQVTDFKPTEMEVRCLMSAADSGKAFDLRCEVREKLIAWLQAEHPHALPTTRISAKIRGLAVEEAPQLP